MQKFSLVSQFAGSLSLATSLYSIAQRMCCLIQWIHWNTIIGYKRKVSYGIFALEISEFPRKNPWRNPFYWSCSDKKIIQKKCIALFPSNDLCLSNMKKFLLIILINGDSTTDAFQEIFWVFRNSYPIKVIHRKCKNICIMMTLLLILTMR